MSEMKIESYIEIHAKGLEAIMKACVKEESGTLEVVNVARVLFLTKFRKKSCIFSYIASFSAKDFCLAYKKEGLI